MLAKALFSKSCNSSTRLDAKSCTLSFNSTSRQLWGIQKRFKIDMSTPIELLTEAPSFDHDSYRSPVVESDEASATFEEPVSAHDSVSAKELVEMIQQLGKWRQLYEATRPATYSQYPQSLPNGLTAMWHPPEEPLGAEIDMSLQPETRPMSQISILPRPPIPILSTDDNNSLPALYSRLRMLQGKAIGAQHDTGAECSTFMASELAEYVILHVRAEEIEKKRIALSWIDKYATAKATEEASDSKSESNSVAVVRNTFGSDSQEKPSRLKPSPTRKYLPMMLQGKAIGAQHDTGAEGSNFMTRKLAEDLKLHIRTKESDRKSFSMGTGKVRRAVGRVKAWCTFAKESGTRMKCWFYVLPKLASPLIMGSQFLRDTKTMSHFTHRLEDQPSCTPFAPMVNLISSTQQAKRRLIAFIDDRQTYINADSGSHLDLVSSAYTKKYGYNVDRRRECRKRIRLADATTAETIGQVKVELMLHDGSTYLKTFDVLPGLTSEVLIGEDTLAELKIFTEHESSFIDVLGGERHFELSILSYLGRVNEFLVRKLNRSNRRSQYQYQRELSLGLSPVFRY